MIGGVRQSVKEKTENRRTSWQEILIVQMEVDGGMGRSGGGGDGAK